MLSIILFKLNSIRLITKFLVSSSILLTFLITVIAFFKLKKTYYDKLYEDIQEEVMLDFVKNKDKIEPVEVNE